MLPLKAPETMMVLEENGTEIASMKETEIEEGDPGLHIYMLMFGLEACFFFLLKAKSYVLQITFKVYRETP